MATDNEDEQLRLVTLQNAQSVLQARQRAEEALRKHSEWLRITLASIGDGVISTDIEGRVTFVNTVAERLTGWPMAEALGLPLPEIFHVINEQTGQPVENPALRALAEGRIVALANHIILIARDGTERRIDDSASPIRDASGAVSGAVLVFRDVTERKQADEALRQSEEKFKLLFQRSPLPKWVFHVETLQFLDVNESAIQHYGYTREEFLRMNVLDVRTAEAGEALKALLASSPRRLPATDACQHRKKNGEIIDVEVHWNEITLNQERVWLASVLDVTERKRAEQALRESQQRLALFIEHAPAAIAMFDREMRYLAVSKRWLEDYRLSTPVLGRSHYETFPEIPQRWKEVHRRGLAGEVLQADADSFLRADGTTQHVKWEVRPWHTPAGEIGGILVAAEDVTRRVEAAAALRQSEERFRSLVSVIADVPWSTDPDGAFVTPQEAYSRYTGKSWEELRGFGWTSCIHPDDRDELVRVWKNAVATRTTYDTPCREWHGPTQQWRHVIARGTPVLNADGSVREWVGTLTDVHERLLADAALRESEQRKAAILQSAIDCLITMDHEGRILDFNPAAERTFGYQRANVVGKTVADTMIPPRLRQAHWDGLDRYLRTGEGPVLGRLIELPALRADGTEFPAEISIIAVQPDQGPHLFTAFLRDITQRKRAEQDVRQSEERFRSLVSIITDIPWTTDPEGRFIRPQPAWAAYTGQSWEQMRDFGWSGALHPEDRENVQRIWDRACRDRTAYRSKGRLWHAASQQYRHFEAQAVPMLDAGGALREWVGACTDVEEQVRIAEERQAILEAERAARSQAEHAGRMKDEFLATLSHELRTPLNAILGYAQLMHMAKMDPAEVQEAAQTIERNARLQAQLIEDLLDMNRIISGKLRLDMQRLHLPQAIEEAVKTVRPSVEAKGVRLELLLDPHAAPVRGDPSRIQQVVWNLLSNAIKFTPKGGKVQVSLARVSSHVELSVIDTGAGISADFLPYVFDRFRQADGSTTRRHGGLGLGLAIVKHLVELHGGTVKVYSPGEGQGATFIVSLPVLAALARDDIVEKEHHRSLTADSPGEGWDIDLSGVAVLVVDDDPDATRLVRRVLEERKAEVAEASSGHEALTVLSDRRFDVLVSDIGMPGEDGYQFLRRVRGLGHGNKNIPAIALTAFARSEDRRRAALAGFQTHLSKPVEAAELLAIVANLAGRTGPVQSEEADG